MSSNSSNRSPPLSLVPSQTRSRAGTLPSTFLQPVSSPLEDFNLASPSSGRMRSGSLFSTNSIWNDESSMESATRNRSYTTNGLSTSPFMKSDINSLLDNLMLSTSPNSRHRAQTYSGISAIPEVPMLQPAPPAMHDDFDLSSVVITNNFENPNLGPTKFLLFDNLPLFVTSSKLWSILANSLGSRASGSVVCIKTTTTSTSKLALVECSTLEIAMSLKASFNHLEIVSGVILYVAFAKCEDEKPKSTEPAPTNLSAIQDSLLYSATKLGSPSVDLNKVVSLIKTSLSYPNENYQDNFGPLPAPILIRQFDAPKLRELRKTLEFNESIQNGTHHSDSDDSELHKVLSQTALEQLCMAMLDELPELCYDYLGNTIVQKIFSLVKSPLIKYIMVKEIAPYLTQLSIHKNGTWAIQKVINLCHHNYQEQQLIASSLKPYATKLFNDQFGNYVIQACVKFGPPFNDFIFEAMLDNFTEISFGRFGSRCIRTILETNGPNVVSNEQVVLVSSLIIEYANELVVNNNGSLLITWFLDTFSGCGTKQDNRFALLTQKFLPYLSSLCVHKLANLTILKILNNRTDFRSKQLIMDTIFGHFDDSEDEVTPASHTLEAILTESPENTAGPLFIYKILSNPLLLNLNNDERDNRGSRYQKFVIQQIRRLLLEISINNYQPYKKLMDEVGLSSTRLNRSNSLSRRGKRNGNLRNGSHPPGNNYMTPPAAAQVQQPVPQFNFNDAPIMPPHQPVQPSLYQPVMTQPMMAQNVYSFNQVRPPQPMAPMQQDLVMQQLEQLSLSSAALGYQTNPDTPGDDKRFF